MRNIFFISVLLIASTNVFSQKLSSKDFIKPEKRINVEGFMYNMEIHGDISSYSDVLSSLYNDTLFFFRADLSNPETISVYALSLNSGEYSFGELDARELMTENRSYYIHSFAVSNDYLVITSASKGDFLYVYKRNGNIYKYDTKIKYIGKLFGDKIYFLPDGKLLGLQNYLYHGVKPEESSKLSILNLSTKEIEKVVDLEFLLPLYTLRAGYNILSINENSILFAQRGDYKISEYDFSLNIINTIENKEIKWNRMPQRLSDSVYASNKYATSMIPFLSRNIDKYNCIHHIYSSDNTLFVFYSKSGSYEKKYYDIWAKENGKWVLKKKDISDNSNSIRKIAQESILYAGRNIYLSGNKFIRLDYYIPDLGYYPKPFYLIKAKNYVMKNELPYAVDIINFEMK